MISILILNALTLLYLAMRLPDQTCSVKKRSVREKNKTKQWNMCSHVVAIQQSGILISSTELQVQQLNNCVCRVANN